MVSFEAVICGGGIAGVEALLRLRRLAGDRVGVTLISPDESLVYRPMAVQDPFSRSPAREYPLERVAQDTGAIWLTDRLVGVDLGASSVQTQEHGSRPYDALLLALGAREEPPFAHGHAFTGRNADEILHGLVQDMETGYVKSIAFVLPRAWVWPLPLYELALMTAERAASMNVEPKIAFITAEPRPLKAFGHAAGEAVERLMGEAGIELLCGVSAEVPDARHVLAGRSELRVERIVTLPKVTGRVIPGISAGTAWFIPIDDRCVVEETVGKVFAAGDATDSPVKHGGLGAQQADTAAAGIAHLAGVGERPPPLRPVIRGMLLTGHRPLYLSAELAGDRGWRSHVYEEPPWPADEKVVAEELGPYLRALDREPSSGSSRGR